MARPVVPDTTAFVGAIRAARLSFFEDIMRGRVWVCSVVLCELLAGTRTPDEARQLDRLAAGARRADRLLVPTHEEWEAAGRLLARRVRLHGALQPRDHLADALILLAAARLQGEVVTANVRHFEAWAILARRAGYDVVVSPAS